jgi:hypothetical protein
MGPSRIARRSPGCPRVSRDGRAGRDGTPDDAGCDDGDAGRWIWVGTDRC